MRRRNRAGSRLSPSRPRPYRPAHDHRPPPRHRQRPPRARPPRRRWTPPSRCAAPSCSGASTASCAPRSPATTAASSPTRSPAPPRRPAAARVDVLVLNRAEVEALLDLGALLDALRDGFVALTGGEVTAPGRNELTMPDEAFLLGMPGRLRDGAMTVKVVTVFESHDPSHLATIGLYDARDGACRAFMDGTYITAIRTSAAAAVATDLLAREDAKTLAIIGAGVQGEHHLKTFPLVRDFDEIRVSSLYRRGRPPARRAAPARTRRRRSRGRGARRGRRGAGHARRAAGDRAGLDRARHARQLGRLPPARRRAPARAAATARRCSSRPTRRSSRRPVGCAELEPGSPATELGEVLLGRAPGRTRRRTRSPSTRRWATSSRTSPPPSWSTRRRAGRGAGTTITL